MRRTPVVLALVLAALVAVTASRAGVRQAYSDWRHTDGLAGAVREVPVPGPPRAQPAVVRLGDGRLLLWGGRGHGGDSGVVHDPADGSWEDLPPAPGPGRFAAATAWTGREAVIWGGSTRSDSFVLDPGGVAYDPATGTWRTLPPAPVGLFAPRAVALPGGLLVTGGDPGRTPADLGGLWLDDASGQWSAVPAPFQALVSTWSGDRLVAAGPVPHPDGTAPPRPGAAGLDEEGEVGRQWAVMSFDPLARAWEPYAEPVETEWMALASRADGSVHAVTLEGLNEPLRAYAADDQGQWALLAETARGADGVVTIEPVGYPPVVAPRDRDEEGDGNGGLYLGGEGALTRWDPETARFAHLSDPAVRSFGGGGAVWTGGSLVSLGGQGGEGWAFTPAPE